MIRWEIPALLRLGVISLMCLCAMQVTAAETTTYSFGVVPQQSASKLARVWAPLLAWVGRERGLTLRFKTAPDIPAFEQRLAQAEYDFAYMNPYHYTVFNQHAGYRAMAHARDNRITGIIVVSKDSPYTRLEELEGRSLAFPSPAAFAASILTRSEFAVRNIHITPQYVSSHDSVYRSVAKGLYPAGGGVIRTLNAVEPEVREQLRILWTTPSYTPHAIAVHPRVPADVAESVRDALIALEGSEEGRTLLEPLRIKGWQAAEDSAWDDVRALNIQLLDDLTNE